MAAAATGIDVTKSTLVFNPLSTKN